MSNLRDILKKRYHDRDKGSGTRARALNFPEDVKFWKPKASKRNTINILPYTIKTKNHPLVRSKDAEIGDEDFVLDIWIHQFVGPSGAEILCPKRNFGKPCPICGQADKLREEGKKDGALKLNPSHRVFYNIVDAADDTDAGVQIFQASFKNFHKEMMDEAGAASDGDEAIDFVDFRNGKAVQFRATEESFGAGKKYFEFKSFKFVDREEPLDKALKKDILSLDEFLVVHSYEDIEKLFYGEDDDYGETKDEVAVEEEEEEEEEDEEEEEEKPVAKQKKAPVEVEDNKCPYGLRFGIDCETDPKCDDCEVFSDCYKASKKLKK